MASLKDCCFLLSNSAALTGRNTTILTFSVKTTCVVLSLPRTMLQSFSETLPAALVFPVGQIVQITEPAEAACLPASHLLHETAPNAGATDPVPHLVQPEDPADEVYRWIMLISITTGGEQSRPLGLLGGSHGL